MARTGRPSKKRHVEEDAASSDEEVIKPSKKAKTKTTATATTTSTSTAEGSSGKDGEGNSFWPLGTTRRITIQNFKGKNYVNIREYYETNGELRPGKKGIMLPLEQYNALLTAIPAINAELQSKGHEVPDIFADAPTTSSPKSSTKSPSKEQKRKKKMNIEATSDEEEEEVESN
ncbi:transcriptional Coactivator p15-domain-containing protein [Xylaria cf. heliscus]|nr:transcriptional Coactivator p15-domain-containing protein [Xylaria cf. heliscus]